jgi:hypothetical protein
VLLGLEDLAVEQDEPFAVVGLGQGGLVDVGVDEPGAAFAGRVDRLAGRCRAAGALVLGLVPLHWRVSAWRSRPKPAGVGWIFRR